MRGDTEGVEVYACPNGPFLVRGDISLVTMDADTASTAEASESDAERGAQRDQRRVVALCRCGASSIRPFCDGTHKTIGFRTVRPQR